MLYIFISHYDDYSENVEKIKNIDRENVKKIYWEDYFVNPFKIEESDRIYILTNATSVLPFVKQFGENYYVINKNYYMKNLNKFDIQKHLSNRNISVPTLLEFERINKRSFPIMCKSKKHADFVIAIYTLGTFNSLFSKYNKNDFYLEQLVRINEEIKVYFVKDETYFYDGYHNEKLHKEISDICKKISEILTLDVFSIDVLVCNGKLFVIDINPAAGLFNSMSARKKLVEWI